MIQFSPDALTTVRDFITHQLAVRGINVDVIVRIKEKRNGEQSVEVETTTFQTMPVLAALWTVVDFGSWIHPVEGTTASEVTVSLQARYQLRNGGNNGISLFNFSFHTDGERCSRFIMWE